MMGLIKRAERTSPSERAKMRAYYRKNKGRLRRQRRKRERKPRIKEERHGTPEGGGYTKTKSISMPSTKGGSSAIPTSGGLAGLDFDPDKMPRDTERRIKMRSSV